MFRVNDLNALSSKLQDYLKRNERARNPIWSFICRDKVSCIKQYMNEVSTYSALLSLIEDAVKPNKAGFKFTTIHKGKGMEAENVFIINSPIEIQEAMQHPIAREQEINCHFVALTRSALNLYWLTQ